MKRIDYKKPTMTVVKLQHQTHLLQSSPSGEVGVEDYNFNEYEEE